MMVDPITAAPASSDRRVHFPVMSFSRFHLVPGGDVGRNVVDIRHLGHERTRSPDTSDCPLDFGLARRRAPRNDAGACLSGVLNWCSVLSASLAAFAQKLRSRD